MSNFVKLKKTVKFINCELSEVLLFRAELGPVQPKFSGFQSETRVTRLAVPLSWEGVSPHANSGRHLPWTFVAGCGVWWGIDAGCVGVFSGFESI